MTNRASGTRLMEAVKETHQRRAVSEPDMAKFWMGTALKFGLGLPLSGYGWWLFHHTFEAAAKAWEVGGFSLLSLARFIPAFVVIGIGMSFLAPTQAEAFARFLGLGGIVDKLPGIRKPE